MGNNEKTLLTDGYQIDILMVADFSLYNSFIDIHNGEEYSAQFAVDNYLNAIFEQVIYFNIISIYKILIFFFNYLFDRQLVKHI